MTLPLLADVSWWLPLLYVLVLGHLTNVCVTLYLHRSATHEGVKFSAPVEHAMRFWLWLTTGMNTREWVAVHRKHHAFSDKEGDPHSPHVEGLWEICVAGALYYRRAVRDQEMLEKYGKGCPDDWIERSLYSRWGWGGVAMMIPVSILIFGPWIGLLVWSGMAFWIPVMGNVINGVGHAIGYRNFDTKDESRNIGPLGLLIVGEELHNNHHADPKSAKFRARWYEFDIGWVYIKLLSWVRLARVVYARSTDVKEFAAKHYARASAEASDAVDRASQAIEAAVGRAEAAVERAAENARAAMQPPRPAGD